MRKRLRVRKRFASVHVCIVTWVCSAAHGRWSVAGVRQFPRIELTHCRKCDVGLQHRKLECYLGAIFIKGGMEERHRKSQTDT